jgi:hypothetical protein
MHAALNAAALLMNCRSSMCEFVPSAALFLHPGKADE